jgi:hypothetical protein
MRGVWEGVLPERRSVEEQERVHVGGEWVKRPNGRLDSWFREFLCPVYSPESFGWGGGGVSLRVCFADSLVGPCRSRGRSGSGGWPPGVKFMFN